MGWLNSSDQALASGINAHIQTHINTHTHSTCFSTTASYPSPQPTPPAWGGVGGALLPPACPVLGATLFADELLAVDAGQIFTVPLGVIDGFGARVSAGPGSDWGVALRLERSSTHRSAAAPNTTTTTTTTTTTAQLAGAPRARFASGEARIEGIALQALPGSEHVLIATAAPVQPGSSVQVRMADHRCTYLQMD